MANHQLTPKVRPSILSLCLILFVGSIAAATSAMATEFTVAKLFSDGAVLQRDAAVPIWGTADPGTRIGVAFAGQEKDTITSDAGEWQITLDPLPVSSNPRQLAITCGSQETFAIENVLVGDVWLCAGQSNMAMRVDLARDAALEKADSDLPQLRVYTVDYTPSRIPLADSSGHWATSSSETSGQFSACAFFFGRELHRELDVPIGLIVAARGGSDIAAWTSQASQANEPALSPLLAAWAEKDAAYTADIEAAENTTYQQELAAWNSRARAAVDAGQKRPKKPRQPVNPRDHWHHPAVLYNGMIAPLIPYALRGAIWYQGETNAFTEETSQLYETQLRLLVRDWRDRWNQGNFPFAWVQLPFSSAKQVAWASIRESMRRATSLPNSGMVVTLDLGEENLLHPLNKQAFAHRLALWARAEVYGEDITWSGPLFSGYRAGEKGILLRFAYSDGLAAKDGPLVGFEVRNTEGQWQKADARIRSERVVLSFAETKTVTAIRYAWANHPEGNLINAAELPASPFLTEMVATQRANEEAAATTRSTPAKKQAARAPADLSHPPLDRTNVAALPGSTKRLDVFLLMGQSNMKGRGIMPAEPLRDPRIVMMHNRTDEYFLARHPLHLIGSPVDFSGADNAGVGPGLAFAQTIVAARPDVRVLLIPCAVGGTSLAKWQKGQRLYQETIRRAQLALDQGPNGKTRIAGALWLQGEADSNSAERVVGYGDSLSQLIDDLRAEIGNPDLPFIAGTIGEMRPDIQARQKINAILLDLPNRRPMTACVDGRAMAKSIGDDVHFDTATQDEYGRLYAQRWLQLSQ